MSNPSADFGRRRRGAVRAVALSVAVMGYAGDGWAETGFECLLEPHRTVKVGSTQAGLLAQVFVERGDMVKAGDKVAELEQSVERQNMELANLRATNDADLKLAEEAAQVEEAKLSRRDALLKKKFVAEEAYEKARGDARIKRFEADRAKIALELSRLEATKAKTLFDIRTIKAPISGVVTARRLSGGEYIADERHIVEIAKIDVLLINAFLPLDMFKGIEVGRRARVELEQAYGGTHVAVVTMKDRVVDAASGTFLVRLELKNSDSRIPSGIRCKLILDTPKG
jgi:RND family efflux transporter MFP subunit